MSGQQFEPLVIQLVRIHHDHWPQLRLRLLLHGLSSAAVAIVVWSGVVTGAAAWGGAVVTAAAADGGDGDVFVGVGERLSLLS